MTNAIEIYQQMSSLQAAASALYKSGYFTDAKSEAQAIVKVMAGAELGLPPFASMTGIHIVQGKPVLGSNVIATLVKNDPRYNYHIKTATDTACVIEWLENGKVIGESGFTMKEATAAKLTGKDNWTKYPSDMLFARAISRGARRFAPGIFGGSPVYTPDEMGADVDEDGHVIVEVEPQLTSSELDLAGAMLHDPAVIPAGGRPYSPEVVSIKMVKAIESYPDFEPTDAQLKLLRHGLELCFPGDDNATEKRHKVLEYLLDNPSTMNVSGAEFKAIIEKWLRIEKDSGGAYVIDPLAAKEAQLIAERS